MDRRVSIGIRRPQDVLGETPFADQTYTRGYTLSFHILDIPGRQLCAGLNNEAEYEALVLGMRMAEDAGALHLLAYSDSQLIVKQVCGEYEAKEESIVQYLQQIEELKMKFKSFQLQQIPREANIKANSLSKLVSTLKDCKAQRITVQNLP
ncbi:UNVERIFIED_CONTAM: hypothetical protein Slati_3834800 [Sesamum latifolium]|uniref:RNase H type-1 domain-containing protein n=1 Tax=Sesamum latifolium TaxID=2727402 RepID=A0AAW2TKL9_9LAMI